MALNHVHYLASLSCGYYGAIFSLSLPLNSFTYMTNVIAGFVSIVSYITADVVMLLLTRSSNRSRDRLLHLSSAITAASLCFFIASANPCRFCEISPIIVGPP